MRISKDNIVQYYKNLGYFNVEVESEIEKLNKRNLAVKYIIKPKQRYLIDSIFFWLNNSSRFIVSYFVAKSSSGRLGVEFFLLLNLPVMAPQVVTQ